jgi:DNA-binding NarL/FixJ family response regulator
MGYFSIVNEVFNQMTTIGNTLKNENNSLGKDKIRIMIADDHPLLREALRGVLEKQSDFKVVAEVGDGEEAVRIASELIPDVIIMDISMPRLNGLKAIQKIKAKNLEIMILVLTVHDSNEQLLGILEAGADGYLTKSVFGKEVVNAIRSVISGETVISRQMTQQLLKRALFLQSKPVPLEAGNKLTSREMEILKMVAHGMSNKDIASTLTLGLATIKGYMAEIFSKLGVSCRTEAVILGLRAGFINLSDLE